MKISFDFDSTLSTVRMQNLAKKFIADGHDVWITTSRDPSSLEVLAKTPWVKEQNEKLVEIAKYVGIPEHKIVYTAHQIKWEFLINFDMHFDDDQIEIEEIDSNLPNCIGILILTPYIYE